MPKSLSGLAACLGNTAPVAHVGITEHTLAAPRHVEVRRPEKDPVHAVECQNGLDILESADGLHHGIAAHAGVLGSKEGLVTTTVAEGPATPDTAVTHGRILGNGRHLACMIEVVDMRDDDSGRSGIERVLDRNTRRFGHPDKGLKARFASQQDQPVDIAAIEDAVLHVDGDAMAPVDPGRFDGKPYWRWQATTYR